VSDQERRATRIQLCGRFVARVAGRRIEQDLPGRQGRLLFAYLALNRDRVASRDELAYALWPQGLPSAPESALAALLSKLRRLLPEGALAGRTEIRLVLGPGAHIDVEAARNGIHRADALMAGRDWYGAIGPTLVAYNISQRRFLPGEEGDWIEELAASLRRSGCEHWS
jgi:SARP family transcriptional regulator, regulator of embCAB operon